MSTLADAQDNNASEALSRHWARRGGGDGKVTESHLAVQTAEVVAFPRAAAAAVGRVGLGDLEALAVAAEPVPGHVSWGGFSVGLEFGCGVLSFSSRGDERM